MWTTSSIILTTLAAIILISIILKDNILNSPSTTYNEFNANSDDKLAEQTKESEIDDDDDDNNKEIIIKSKLENILSGRIMEFHTPESAEDINDEFDLEMCTNPTESDYDKIAKDVKKILSSSLHIDSERLVVSIFEDDSISCNTATNNNRRRLSRTNGQRGIQVPAATMPFSCSKTGSVFVVQHAGCPHIIAKSPQEVYQFKQYIDQGSTRTCHYHNGQSISFDTGIVPNQIDVCDGNTWFCKCPSTIPDPEPLPTESPVKTPTTSPTSKAPTVSPTDSPSTKSPTNSPIKNPTVSPTTKSPTKTPTNKPTTPPTTMSPTKSPTSSPTTKNPTKYPRDSPTTKAPTAPIMAPTNSPTTKAPTKPTLPTEEPTTMYPTTTVITQCPQQRCPASIDIDYDIGQGTTKKRATCKMAQILTFSPIGKTKWNATPVYGKYKAPGTTQANCWFKCFDGNKLTNNGEYQFYPLTIDDQGIFEGCGELKPNGAVTVLVDNCKCEGAVSPPIKSPTRAPTLPSKPSKCVDPENQCAKEGELCREFIGEPGKRRRCIKYGSLSSNNFCWKIHTFTGTPSNPIKCDDSVCGYDPAPNSNDKQCWQSKGF